MEQAIMLFLSMLCFIVGMIWLVKEVNYVSNASEIQLFSFTKILYSFVYGFLPAIILYRECTNQNVLVNLDTSLSGLSSFALILLMSIVGYCALSVGYSTQFPITVGFKKKFNEEKIHLIADRKASIVMVLLLIVIGWLSLYLWTKVYGSIWAFIENAALIRSGYGLKNDLAFFKEFSRVIIFGLYGSFILFLTEKNKFVRPFYLLLSIVAGFGCYVFVMASDSRTNIAAIVIGLALIKIDFNVKEKGKSMQKQLFVLGVVMVLGFFLISISEPVMNAIRNNDEYSYSGFDIFSSVEKEFRYIPQTQQTVLNHQLDHDFHYKLIDDVYLALLSWFPSRFRPSNKPETLWAYNTSFQIESAQSGIWPTDMLSAGIYHIGIVGIFLLPFVYGCLLRVLENLSVLKKYGEIEKSIYYGIFSIFLINVSHFELSNLAQRLFPLFLTLCLYFTLRTIIGSRRKTEKKLLILYRRSGNES